jgi:hypothetical protein
MQSVSQTTLDKINQSASYSMSGGCWIEYNMNDLIAGTTVTSPVAVVTKTDSVTKKQYQPYKKIFPLTSIIDPRRPSVAGINYFILNPSVTNNIPKYNISGDLSTRTYFSSSKVQYKFWLSPQAGGTILDNCNFTVEYPVAQTAVANTIVIKFETSYSKPVNWNIKIQDHAGAESTISTNGAVPDNGVFQIYYNGSDTWSTTKFSTPTAPKNIKKIIVTASSISKANSFLGVIEVGARYIQDVSNRIQSFQTTKSSSDASDGIVPVGQVTANAFSISLEGYDRAGVEYDKTFAFNKDKINLYKNIKFIPFNKIDLDIIPQGVFYVDSFSISEFGDMDIQCLDGAKFLQEIMAPDIVMQDAPSQAIIRRLLDSIGFTNYNFNTYGKNESTVVDSATIVPLYWYTTDTQTVWQHIQSLCQDTQMIATFDSNDILQFYPRDYLFDKTRSAAFKLRSETKSSNLANIIALNKSTVPSVKAVKVIYTPVISTNYQSSSDNLYVSPPSALGAAALQTTLKAAATPETDCPKGAVSLSPVTVYGDLADTTFYNKTGYFLINNEIIEYDAMEFQYESIAQANVIVKRWITSDSDVAKYLGESKIGTMKPTLRYRIKERNVFNATGKGVGVGDEHQVEIADLKLGWQGLRIDTTAKTSTQDNSVFSLQSTNSAGTSISSSLMTLSAPSASKEYHAAKIQSDPFATEQYFSVGTSMFFSLARDKNNRSTGEQFVSAGIGIGWATGTIPQYYTPGTAPTGNTSSINGYILKIATSQNVANKGLKSRDVQLFKIVNGVETAVSDTQTAEDNSITGISGGELYRVDIKVSQADASKRIFKIKFNNTVITATDNLPIPITNDIALISLDGTVSFDYVYSAVISKQEYDKAISYDNYGSYIGNSSAIQNVFGEFLANGTDSSIAKAPWIKEFGPVAREIKKISTKYATRPGFVKYPQIILNPNASILGYTADSFGIEAYILNNTGTFIDFTDGGEKSFIVVGETIAPLDPFEYIEPDLTSTKNEEQVAFESTWIQKESEAIQLSKWMRTQWSKQQTVLSIDIFPNPLLEIGDIVEVSYPSNLIYSSEDAGKTATKYIVLDVDQSFSQSPSTNILCRSIYV